MATNMVFNSEKSIKNYYDDIEKLAESVMEIVNVNNQAIDITNSLHLDFNGKANTAPRNCMGELAAEHVILYEASDDMMYWCNVFYEQMGMYEQMLDGDEEVDWNKSVDQAKSKVSRVYAMRDLSKNKLQPRAGGQLVGANTTKQTQAGGQTIGGNATIGGNTTAAPKTGGQTIGGNTPVPPAGGQSVGGNTTFPHPSGQIAGANTTQPPKTGGQTIGGNTPVAPAGGQITGGNTPVAPKTGGQTTGANTAQPPKTGGQTIGGNTPVAPAGGQITGGNTPVAPTTGGNTPATPKYSNYDPSWIVGHISGTRDDAANGNFIPEGRIYNEAFEDVDRIHLEPDPSTNTTLIYRDLGDGRGPVPIGYTQGLYDDDSLGTTK